MMLFVEKEVESHGERIKGMPIQQLEQLSTEIEQFGDTEKLNGFQEWILQHKYQFRPQDDAFPVQSVLVIAIPHPAYANVQFEKDNRQYRFKSLVRSDFERCGAYLSALLASHGYHLQPAPDLPLKRLAVRSGLARYGRNNITYVEGLGSFFSLDAYFTDMPCESVPWAELRMAEPCTDCQRCRTACPTGAIREERFLIDNERCLSYFNEMPGDFPVWLPPAVHHTLYDCLYCQMACPMNKPYASDVLESVSFDQNETELLLSGAAYGNFPPALQRKADLLGLTEWLPAIPRNLQVLFEQKKEKFTD